MARIPFFSLTFFFAHATMTRRETPAFWRRGKNLGPLIGGQAFGQGDDVGATPGTTAWRQLDWARKTPSFDAAPPSGFADRDDPQNFRQAHKPD
jgi:hypothetical protein